MLFSSRGSSFIYRKVVQEALDRDTQLTLEQAQRRTPNLQSGNAGIIVTLADRPFFPAQAAWQAVKKAYSALFVGSFGSPNEIMEGWRIYWNTGDAQALRTALRPLSESLVTAIPYVFAGLAVALGFQAGFV